MVSLFLHQIWQRAPSRLHEHGNDCMRSLCCRGVGATWEVSGGINIPLWSTLVHWFLRTPPCLPA